MWQGAKAHCWFIMCLLILAVDHSHERWLPCCASLSDIEITSHARSLHPLPPAPASVRVTHTVTVRNATGPNSEWHLTVAGYQIQRLLTTVEFGVDALRTCRVKTLTHSKNDYGAPSVALLCSGRRGGPLNRGQMIAEPWRHSSTDDSWYRRQRYGVCPDRCTVNRTWDRSLDVGRCQ